jgi:hypothetical protein
MQTLAERIASKPDIEYLIRELKRSGERNMPYEIPLNVIEILKSTLYLLEHTLYPGKDGKTVNDLKNCIVHAINSLSAEAAQAPGD